MVEQLRYLVLGGLFCGFTAMVNAQSPGFVLNTLVTPSAAHTRPPADHRGAPPPNDLCENAVITPLPYLGSTSVSGNNIGATDTEDFGNPVAWEAFSIDTCSTVTVSYCGTQPVHGVVYSILIIGCPGIESVQNDGDSLCTDGNGVIRYENLTAGTYYVPVLLMPGTSEGPYTMTFTSEACDLPPLNDRCSTAQPLAVVNQCGAYTPGNNANTVIDSPPSCASSTAGFKDVWYVFNSDANTEVVISIDPGTMSHTGVEVRTTCTAGSQVFCATDDTSYVVQVLPDTEYRVRVFTDQDLGLPGTFGICISSPTAPPVCDGGDLSFANGGDSLLICQTALGVEAIDFATSSGEGSLLLVTDTVGTILATSSDGFVDLSGYAVGAYQITGVSYAGDLSGATPGSPLSGISSSGGCLDFTDLPLVLDIDICQDAPADSGDLAFGFIASADGRQLEVLWNQTTMPVSMRVVDMRGSLVLESSHLMTKGGSWSWTLPGSQAPGIYCAQVLADGRRATVRWVVR